LPIQREKYTDFPVCQASAIKGAVREWFEERFKGDNEDEKKIVYTFGPDFERGDGEAFAGAATFTDGRMLLFPIRSLNGVFAYTTSRFVLSRFRRDASMAGFKDIHWNVPALNDNKVLGVKNCGVRVKGQSKIVLEEYTFDFEENGDVEKIAEWLSQNALPKDEEYNDFWCTKIKTDLVILPDDVFRDFVKLSTEVQARIRINNETKTVDKGALFYEEALPSDTLLYSVIMVHDPACDSSRRPAGLRDFNDVMAFLCTLNGNRLQLGGDVTIGRGILNLNVLNGGK